MPSDEVGYDSEVTRRPVEAGVHARGLLRRHADRVLPVHELIVVQSGVLHIAEESRRFAVHAGEWVLLRAGRRHYGYSEIDPSTWFYWICFGAQGPGDLGPGLQGRQAGSVARPDRVRTLFEQMLQDQVGGLLTSSTAGSYLQLLLTDLALEPVGGPQPSGTELARRAASLIAERVGDPDLSTARVASALACNADYLGRTFREAFGETPTMRIHRLRAERACVLFRAGNASTEIVANEVGFRDVRYFRRVFRRAVGLTPGEFKRLPPIPAQME